MQTQILHYVPRKLPSAASKLAENAIRAEPCCVPVFFGDTENVSGADDKLRLGKRELVQHKAAPRVKRFADDNRGLYAQSALVGDGTGEKGVVAGVPRFVLWDYRGERNAVFCEHVGIKLAVGVIVPRINVRLTLHALPFAEFDAQPARRQQKRS